MVALTLGEDGALLVTASAPGARCRWQSKR